MEFLSGYFEMGGLLFCLVVQVGALFLCRGLTPPKKEDMFW